MDKGDIQGLDSNERRRFFSSFLEGGGFGGVRSDWD